MHNKTPKLKVLQDARVVNYLPTRSGLPKPPEFVLVNILPGLTLTEMPQTRLVIPIRMKQTPESEPQPVRITHR